MIRKIAFLSVVLAIVSLTALAVEWEEIASGAFIRVDSKTGQAEVVFSITLEYDHRPKDSSLVGGWTVYGPDGEVLSEFHRRTTLGGPVGRISIASEAVPVVAGATYRGVVTADDEVNGLHFEKTIAYTAPVALPVGISLRGMNGTEEFDLTGVPDEELEELATIYDRLSTDYEIEEEGVSLSEFFTDYAGEDEDFPALVIVIPLLGVESTLGPSSSPIIITINRMLHVYPVADPGAVSGLTEQLSVYDREFVGLVFTGGGDQPLYDGITAFVGQDAWKVLKAASEEEARRLAEED